VVDYSEPLRPRLKRPFSESRIARHVRAQQLATVSEGDEKSKKLKNDSTIPESQKPDFPNEDELNYKPSNPEFQATLDSMTAIITRNIREEPEELGSKSTDSIIRIAVDAILDVLKDPTLGDEDQLGSIVDILDTDIAQEDFNKLKDLADKITDYSPPPDATPTDASGSTTVGQNSSSGTLFIPSSYPDPESITADTLTGHTFTGSHTPPLDLLIRTSGVERLSDFMLWQCHQDTEIYFLQCMWPEFDLWHFLPVLLEWQWLRKEMKGDRLRTRRKAT
jgi:ditrans,polycis-polyprenyl diphosphate synthase